MNRLRTLATYTTAAALLLLASAAQADAVFVIPARGQVPDKVVTANIAHESRFVMAELGHTLVDDAQTQASIAQVPDGQPDDADEFALLARATKASWVVLPTISMAHDRYRLELTAYEAGGGRVESVARDIDATAVHQQILEMARLLLRPEGVGTGALPWERRMPGARPAAAPAAEGPEEKGTKEKGSSKTPAVTVLAAAGLGVSTALKRPDGATGNSTAAFGALRAGVGLGDSLEVVLGFRGHVSGPRALSADGAARYLVPLAMGGRLRLGPEVGLGAFIQRGGSKDTDLLVRVNAVASMQVTGPVSVEAAVGDISWIPASSGALVLGGGALYGVARF